MKFHDNMTKNMTESDENGHVNTRLNFNGFQDSMTIMTTIFNK